MTDRPGAAGIPSGIAPCSTLVCDRCGGSLEPIAWARATCGWCRALGLPPEAYWLGGPGRRCASCHLEVPDPPWRLEHERSEGHLRAASRFDSAVPAAARIVAPSFPPRREEERREEGVTTTTAETVLAPGRGPDRRPVRERPGPDSSAGPSGLALRDAGIAAMLRAGSSYREISRDLGVGRSRIARVKRQLEKVGLLESPE